MKMFFSQNYHSSLIHHDSTMTMYNFRYVVFGLMVMLLVPAITIDAEALHMSDKVTWQLVYVSDQSGCGPYHHHQKNLYDELTEKYMTQVYGFENTKYPPVCVSEDDYSDYEKPLELDLHILIYGNDLGERELHQYDIGGLYHHVGNTWFSNHTIIICDCSSFDYSEPVWLLSHELTHFILYYMGYDDSIAEDFVHELDDRHDYCLEIESDASCSDVVSKLRLDSKAYSFNVMAPYTIEEAPNEFGLQDIIDDSKGLKLITKWWIEGKISEVDYREGVSDLVSLDKLPTRDRSGFLSADSVKIFTEPSKGNMEKEYDSESVGSISGALRLIQNTTSADNVLNDLSDIPDWYQNKAISWLDGNVGNDNFSNGIVHMLQNMREPNEILSSTVIYDSQKSFGSESVGLERKTVSDSVKVAGWVMPETGLTDITIRDERITSDSVVTYIATSNSEITLLNCQAPTIEDGKFHVHCDNHLDNTLIEYQISTIINE